MRRKHSTEYCGTSVSNQSNLSRILLQINYQSSTVLAGSRDKESPAKEAVFMMSILSIWTEGKNAYKYVCIMSL